MQKLKLLAYCRQEAPVRHVFSLSLQDFSPQTVQHVITNFSFKSQPLSICNFRRKLTFLGSHIFHKSKAVHVGVLCSQEKSRSENEATCHLHNILAAEMFPLSSWQISWRNVSPWRLHSTVAVTPAWHVCRNPKCSIHLPGNLPTVHYQRGLSI